MVHKLGVEPLPNMADAHTCSLPQSTLLGVAGLSQKLYTIIYMHIRYMHRVGCALRLQASRAHTPPLRPG